MFASKIDIKELKELINHRSDEIEDKLKSIKSDVEILQNSIWDLQDFFSYDKDTMLMRREQKVREEYDKSQ